MFGYREKYSPLQNRNKFHVSKFLDPVQQIKQHLHIFIYFICTLNQPPVGKPESYLSLWHVFLIVKYCLN